MLYDSFWPSLTAFVVSYDQACFAISGDAKRAVEAFFGPGAVYHAGTRSLQWFSGHGCGREAWLREGARLVEYVDKGDNRVDFGAPPRTPIDAERLAFAFGANVFSDVDQPGLVVSEAPRGFPESAHWERALLAVEGASRTATVDAARRPRLLMCCCMNVDGHRPRRADHYEALARNFRRSSSPCAPVHGHWAQPYSRAPATAAFVARMRAAYPCATYLRGSYVGADGECSDDAYRHVLLSSDFVFSPQGHGEANFRDVEAVVAGAIPVLDAPRRTRLRSLFADMPAVFVDDWNNVTPAFLEAEYAAAVARGPAAFDVAKAYWPFWLHGIVAGLLGDANRTSPRR